MMPVSFEKLEEKITLLLSELEKTRHELLQARQENSVLKTEKLSYTKKLQELLALLDSVDIAENQPIHKPVSIAMTPDTEEYALI
jgi:FtsZ-binding cell division protein ZapB